MAVLKDLAAAKDGRVSDKQREALDEIARAFKLS
jgi:hypothetical protein